MMYSGQHVVFLLFSRHTLSSVKIYVAKCEGLIALNSCMSTTITKTVPSWDVHACVCNVLTKITNISYSNVYFCYDKHVCYDADT